MKRLILTAVLLAAGAALADPSTIATNASGKYKTIEFVTNLNEITRMIADGEIGEPPDNYASVSNNAMSAVQVEDLAPWAVDTNDVIAAANSQLLGDVSLERDSYILVANGTNDAHRGALLRAAYTAATTFTPGGIAKSHTNRVSVILPPGMYDLGTTPLTLDTSFVDLIAQVPEEPGREEAKFQGYYKHSITAIRGDCDVAVIIQEVDWVRLVGFSILNTRLASPPIYVSESTGGENSYYEKLYMWTDSYSNGGYKSPHTAWIARPTHSNDVSGVWRDCVADHDYAWRVGVGPLSEGVTNITSKLTAKMYNCHAGQFSFGGDGMYEFYQITSDHAITNAYFEDCSAGYASFSGCAYVSIRIDEDVTFVDCDSGHMSFCVGNVNAATMIRCTAGNSSGGAGVSPSWPAAFTGTAIDCRFGQDSFGGSLTAHTLGNEYAYLGGTLIRCESLNSTQPRVCYGAEIDSCWLQVTNAATPALLIQDAQSTIINSRIETDGGMFSQSMTALGIFSWNVVSCGNIFNTAIDAAKVTNTATTSADAVY